MRNDERAPETSYVPPLDIHEDEEKFTVWCDLPGVDPKDVDIRCERGRLRIAGKARAAREAPYLLREYGVGDYARELHVTDTIDLERVTAEASDGVLVITLPKAAVAKPRRIEVRTA
jgi:HSP20 family molecular chaperone IbpA